MNVFEFFGALFSYLLALIKIIPFIFICCPISIVGVILFIWIASEWHKENKRVKKMKEEDPDYDPIYIGNPWGGY
ncbi:MAG: hypothetical protein K5640_01455 [Treponema sp.]|nr:hypothetical protein [Treponema sp.]